MILMYSKIKLLTANISLLLAIIFFAQILLSGVLVFITCKIMGVAINSPIGLLIAGIISSFLGWKSCQLVAAYDDVDFKLNDIFKHKLYTSLLLGSLLPSLILFPSIIILIFFKLYELRINYHFNFNSFLIYSTLWFFVAISEELIFRGYLFDRSIKENGTMATQMLFGFVFSMIHLVNPLATLKNGYIGLVNIFLSSILLGHIKIKTNSLLSVIIFHFVWNFIQGSVFDLNVSGTDGYSNIGIFSTKPSGSTLLTGGAFGLEGSITISVGLLLLLIYYKHESNFYFTTNTRTSN